MVINANFRNRHQALLNDALYAERQGEIATAIELYMQFEHVVVEEQSSHPAEIFTRLPLLLLKSGREQEGWHYFHRYFTRGCPGRTQPQRPEEKWHDRAMLCDKARLFLQRAGHHDRAILYGIHFYVARCLTVYHCRHLGQLGPMRSQKALSSIVRPLLRKAEKEQLEMAIVSELKQALHLGPKLDVNRVMARMALIIAIHNAQQRPLVLSGAII